ncbi:hypothetical protein FACS1894166_13210 [Bacilli bacterium]|nr:hypothetical protein FACS1894166_13210 [Bacilli bacterium]
MDFCKYYQQISEPAKIAQCNAHIDRYLRPLDVDYKISKAKMMIDLLYEMKSTKENLIKNNHNQMANKTYQNYREHFIRFCNSFLKKYELMSEIDQFYYKDGLLLFKRMKEHVDQHLAFIKDFDVPYSNNQIERDFRNTKTKMKVSGCFKNVQYAMAFASIRSFIQTCIKRKINT